MVVGGLLLPRDREPGVNQLTLHPLTKYGRYCENPRNKGGLDQERRVKRLPYVPAVAFREVTPEAWEDGRRHPDGLSTSTCAKLACSDGTCALSQSLPVNSLLQFRLQLTTEEPKSKTRWFATEHQNKRRNVTTEYVLWSSVQTIGLPNLNIYKPAMLPLDVLGTISGFSILNPYTLEKTSVFFFKNAVI